MRLIITSTLVACSLLLNAQIENGCISIDFETFPDETPVSGLVLSDQYKDAFGLSFRLEGGGFPVLAQVGGNVAEAFSSQWGNDTPMPGVDIGEFFLTDDGQLSGLTSPPIILDFETPIDSFAGCILDMDFEEFFIIQALDETGTVILEERIDAGDPGTGDGALTCWGFNLPGCEGAIYSIRYAGFRPASTGGAFGLGMDFFSFCYSGLRIDTETTPVTCNGPGSINIFSTSDEVYEFSIDDINYSTDGFFDGLDEGVQTIYVKDDEDCTTTVDVVVELEVDELPDPIFVEEQICDGESYSFNGQVYTDEGDYQQTLSAANGCDTLWNLSLDVFPNTSEIVSAEICDGETFILNGQSYSTAGTFEQALNNFQGCDSIIEINLSLLPNTSENINAEICDGESIVINGETFVDEGSYTQQMMNSFGCDSTIQITLAVISNTVETISPQICAGESFILNGETYVNAGSYTQQIMNSTGCDSIIEINLAVNPTTAETISAQICEGESYTLNGESFNSTGTYIQQLTNNFGCDSTLSLNLDVLGTTTGFVNAQVCEGETYELNGQSYNTAGSYTQNLNNVAGCDSTITLQLALTANSSGTLSEQICEGSTITINGTSYNTAGSYAQNLVNGAGCDSLLTIGITVLPAIETCEIVSIFEGETFTLNGQSYTAAGTYEQLLQTSNGCDSLVILKLDVLPAPVALVHYDFNNCKAGGSSYDEFVPRYDEGLECAEINASIISRPSGLSHSCTPGEMGSGMCISSDPSCTYEANSIHRLVFDVVVNPTSGPVNIAGLNFFEKAPTNYVFNTGGTGLNNYPTLYTFKLYKNGTEIYLNEDVETNREWTEQSFTFDDVDSFVFSEPGILTVEFLPFCPIGVSSNVSAWDIDELSLFGYCQPASNRVVGNVMTTKVEPLSQVEIGVNEAEAWTSYSTDQNGVFAFETDYNQSSVLIEPYKNDDPLNGVSTLDLIHLQRHLLGRQKLEDFTNLIAADINKDDEISLSDLIELRKLILGIHERFPENTSWRFIDAKKKYASLSELNDQMFMTGLDEEINLEGIKVGDINQSYVVGAQGTALESRSQSNFKLIAKTSRNKAGELSVGFYASEDFNLSGFQASFNINDSEDLKVTPHKINITQQNYHLDKDVLKMSWTNEGEKIKGDELLFELVFAANAKETPIHLDVNAQNEIYQASDLSAHALVLEYENESIYENNGDAIQLFVNPNPFKAITSVQIVSKESFATKYELIDCTGKLIESNALQLETGINEINLNGSDFPGAGIYYIMIRQNQSVFMKRIVLL